jgi:hypothetical protein
MATMTPSYASRVAITMDLAGLASSSTLVAGRESSQINNTSDKYMDAMISGTISVGTSPTAGPIVVYVWGADTSLATTAIDVLDGTDSAETLTNTGILNRLKPLATINVLATTSDIAYPVICESVASVLGLPCLPPFWGLFTAHATVAALRNTSVNTNSLGFVGIKFDVA